jgi:hypothetical protein
MGSNHWSIRPDGPRGAGPDLRSVRLHRRLAPSPAAQGNGADSRLTARLVLTRSSWTLRGYPNRSSPSTAVTSSSRLRTGAPARSSPPRMTSRCGLSMHAPLGWAGRPGELSRIARLDRPWQSPFGPIGPMISRE